VPQIEYIFHDTDKELPETYDYLLKVEAYLGKPIVRLDSRLAKTISIKERYRIIGQFEVFNLLNHANYGGYTTAITSAGYGLPAQSSDLSYTPRMLQLAARFEF